ncbi:MAG: glycosyltransferase [Acuticoccus sp.]
MTALALLSLAIWLVLLLARGAFWRTAGDMLPAATAPAGQDGADAGPILAIVPARDEADVLPRTLPLLLAQEVPGGFSVLLVDDHSTDGTAEVARRLAAEADLSARLDIVQSKPLPAGWTGKLWAMRCGLAAADAAGTAAPRILFTDADIAWQPGALAGLVAESERRGAVLASLMVRLRAASAAERWLIPPFVYFFRMLYPFRWVADPHRRTAAAAGGAMLIDRAALQRAGGLAAIRTALIDDVAMGTLMKREGPVWLGLTKAVHSVRAYASVGDVRAMVVRSAYAELRYSPWRLLVAIAGLALTFVVPPVAALWGDGAVARLAGLAAWAAMALSFAPMAALYGVGLWRGVLLPAVAALYGVFTVESAVRSWRGEGGRWKGRIQAATHRGTGLGEGAVPE